MKTERLWPQPRDPKAGTEVSDVILFSRFPGTVGLWQVLEPGMWPQQEEVGCE